MSTAHHRHIDVRIELPVVEVYDFLAEPSNFPRWASGLAGNLQPTGQGDWQAETPAGLARVRFRERNEFGVVDHEVVLADSRRISCPMRVIGDGTGNSLVVFTLYRQASMTDETFARDALWVEQDLAALKALLEGSTIPGGESGSLNSRLAS